MQLLTLTALFSIALPVNAQIMMFALLRMSNFDIYRTEDSLSEIFELSETEPFNAIFLSAGFQTTNFIIESGTLLFIVIGYITWLVLRAVLILALTKVGNNCFT